MSTESIPDDVRRFVLTSVPSVSYLEAMLIFRGKADCGLTVEDLAKALYIDRHATEVLLQALCSAGIVIEQASTFRYAPEEALRQVIDKLALAYPAHLIGITNLIHGATQHAAQQFANAFKWTKGR